MIDIVEEGLDPEAEVEAEMITADRKEKGMILGQDPDLETEVEIEAEKTIGVKAEAGQMIEEGEEHLLIHPGNKRIVKDNFYNNNILTTIMIK